MDLISIIQAYEIFKSHGLEIQNLLSKPSVHQENSIVKEKENEKTESRNDLNGNTQSQMRFLSELLRSGKETPVQRPIEEDKITEIEEEQLSTQKNSQAANPNSDAVKTKSFKEAVTGLNDETKSKPLRQFSTPRIEGGNVVIELDVEDYERGIQDLKFSVIAKLTIQKGEEAPTTLQLKEKLVQALEVSAFKLIPYGRG